MTNQRLNWNSRTEDGEEVIDLAGDIDEDANFEELTAALEGKHNVRINLQGIKSINSIGVREWVNFIRSASSKTKIIIEQCAPVVVTQLNMIANFAGDASVSSIMAPYVCDNCGNEAVVLLEVSSITVESSLATRPCLECDDTMELDDLPESYFAFATLNHQTT